jgi:3-hydroxybutyryl-CoA dehydrogenase
MRIAEEQIADIPTIDAAMKEIGGFRMGPFELTDFIGHDVNYKVTESVWESFYYDQRFKPSLLQKRLVEAGFLGLKSNRGFYDYRENAEKPTAKDDNDLKQLVFDRIIAMLINEACDALNLGIATAEDIELAMVKGLNYPKGLLSWGDEIGADVILGRLQYLYDLYKEDRYRPNILLKQRVDKGNRLNQD